MARLTEKQLIEKLLAKYEPAMRQAFFSAVNDIRSRAVLRQIVDRLTTGDIAGAIEAINITPETYNRLVLVVSEAYNGGGIAFTENMPVIRTPDGGRVVFQFAVRNFDGERWLNEHSSQLVTSIVDDQRNAIRNAMAEGLAEGRNPRDTALDVIGRVNRANGRREGGIVGLTSAQERYVSAARRELLSGDKEQMSHYLTRGRRDKRFDRTIQRHINAGTTPPADLVEKAVGRYSDRLLQLRGETIARTETLTALARVKDDAIRQQIAEGKLDPDDIQKIWHSASDDRVRHSHTVLNLQSVGLNEAFLTPSGSWIAYPGDPDAPASETINCRCWLEYKIDYFASVVRRHNQRRAA